VSGAPADHAAALAALQQEAEARIASAPSGEALQQLRTEYLGRKSGRLTSILKVLPSLGADQRKGLGQQANETKALLERLFDEAAARLSGARPAEVAADLTMPARAIWRGAKHPVTLAVERVTAIFRELGFTRFVGPEVETEWHNFFALNFPKDHPALDLHDTLYVGDGVLLRTHTSPLQIRVMQAYKPPIRVLVPGMCYRKDAFDASHAPAFYQIEGLAVDEGITFVDLKATLALFARRFFGEKTKVRFRPSYFPFTEPSGEMDVECQICRGKGCATCKQTGWAEMLGCGMVHPAVFENVGLDPERYTGWAFGMGPGRMAQQLFGVAQFRDLYDADVRLAAQFVDAE